MTAITVGPNGTYHTISAAVAASNAGDVIEVAAGTYTNDFPSITHNLTLEAVGGRVVMKATQSPPDGKAILDEGGTGVTVTVTGFTFTGARVADNNGAGIRYEGGQLTLKNDVFENNQDGLLSAPDPNGTITVDNSVFVNNGAGDGYTHDIYVGAISSFTADHSYFGSARVGHEIKSRAASTTITNSVIADGPNGTSSYEIDLPNGGNAVITGNTIEKGPHAENPVAISFGEEGGLPPTNTLTVSHNTILDDYSSTGFTAVRNSTSAQATVTHNEYFGFTAANLVAGLATQSHNGLLLTEPSLPSVAETVNWSTAKGGASSPINSATVGAPSPQFGSGTGTGSSAGTSISAGTGTSGGTSGTGPSTGLQTILNEPVGSPSWNPAQAAAGFPDVSSALAALLPSQPSLAGVITALNGQQGQASSATPYLSGHS